MPEGSGEEAAFRTGLTVLGPSVPRWIHVQGWLRKFFASIQLSILGTVTVALFLISLVGNTVENGVESKWSSTELLPTCL